MPCFFTNFEVMLTFLFKYLVSYISRRIVNAPLGVGQILHGGSKEKRSFGLTRNWRPFLLYDESQTHKAICMEVGEKMEASFVPFG